MRLALGAGLGERLFVVDVLAGSDDRQRDFGVRGRRRQIDDKLDFRVGQQLLDSERTNAVRLGQFVRPRHVHVGTGAHIQDVEKAATPEVVVADMTATDDADPNPVHGHDPPRSTRRNCRARPATCPCHSGPAQR